MITAVDTSVLIDFLGQDPQFGRRSQSALRTCAAEGRLIACPVVWAEVSAGFGTPEKAAEALDAIEVDLDPLDRSVALAAGQAWRAYRAEGGSRARILSDFLIGSHALARADRLLTRDRGFYRSCFGGLRLVEP